MRPSRRVDDLFVDQDEWYPDIRQQLGSAPANSTRRGTPRAAAMSARRKVKPVAKVGVAVATDNTSERSKRVVHGSELSLHVTPADNNVVHLGSAQGLVLASGRACTKATAFSLGLVNRWPSAGCWR